MLDSLPFHEPGAPAPKNSGSQKRQRCKSLQIALTPGEYAEVMARAAACGLSPSSYGRAALLGAPGPRARRMPTVHAQLLGHAIAALNRIGNLLNQIAHRLNAGGALSLAAQFETTLVEIREAARAIRDAVGRKDRDDYQGKQA